MENSNSCAQISSQYKLLLKAGEEFFDLLKGMGAGDLPEAKKRQRTVEAVRNVLKNQIWELKDNTPCSLEKAEKILGQDYYGPEAIEKVFECRLRLNQIPPLPFSLAEIEEAKKKGEFLILRIDHTYNRFILLKKKMTIKRIRGENPAFLGPAPKFLEDKEDEETPWPGWALVSKKPLRNKEVANGEEVDTQGKITLIENYLQKLLLKYPRKREIYKQKAVEVFPVENLLIPSVTEVVYDTLVRSVTGDYFVPPSLFESKEFEGKDKKIWTNTMLKTGTTAYPLVYFMHAGAINLSYPETKALCVISRIF